MFKKLLILFSSLVLVSCGGGGSTSVSSSNNSSPSSAWVGTKQLGVAGAQTFGNSDTTDNSGNVYVAGATRGGLDGNTLTGTRDFFVTKYNNSGVKQ